MGLYKTLFTKKCEGFYHPPIATKEPQKKEFPKKQMDVQSIINFVFETKNSPTN